jgi:hypothetical protein
MLKNAKEVFEISKEAKRRELDAARIKNSERKKRYRSYLELQRRAVNAAKNGAHSLTITDLEIDSRQLEDLGFIYKQISLRQSYEDQLKRTLKKKQEELNRHLDEILFSCPSLRFISEGQLYHRNPIKSLLEYIWEKSDCAPIDRQVTFNEILKSTKNIDFHWINENTKKINACFTSFSESKLLILNLEQVSKENGLIPYGYTSCDYVSWNNVNDATANSSLFGPDLLCWYAENWEFVSGVIDLNIEKNAEKGLHSAELMMIFDGFTWKIECQDEEGNFNYIKACAPSVLSNELKEAGFRTSLKVVIYDDDGIILREDFIKMNQLPESNFDEINPENFYVLQINWKIS